MSKLIFTRVFEKYPLEGGKGTFYKLSEPVYKAPNPNFDIGFEKEYLRRMLDEKYKADTPTFIDMICISDAHTHTERLVFWATLLHTGEYASLVGTQLDGKHTWRINGGDKRHVHPHEVYLKRLARANGYKQFELKTEI